MLCIPSPELTHLQTGSLYPLTNVSPFLPLPAPTNHHSRQQVARADFSAQKDGGLSLKVKQSPRIASKSDCMLLTKPAVLQEMIFKMQY